jgi:pimeloyl-ACP methyl ester carboxylesterase
MSYSTYYPFKSEADEKEYWQYYKGTAAQLWPVPFENILVPTDFGSTFVRASGPKNAPPLVLLHGITATSMMWAPNVGAWSKDYRVYAVDIINDYGLSRNTTLYLAQTTIIAVAGPSLRWFRDYTIRLIW